jgi:hypothetical protein
MAQIRLGDILVGAAATVYPTVTPYNGNGPLGADPSLPNANRPDAALDFTMWRESRNPGGLQTIAINQGWDYVRENYIDPEVAFLKTNTDFTNIDVIIHNPFGVYRRYMHLDQWDCANACGYSNLIGSQWDDFADVTDYNLYAYVGSMIAQQPGYWDMHNPDYDTAGSREALRGQLDNMSEYAHICHRNLEPYQRVNAGLLIDVGFNFSFKHSILQNSNSKWYRTQESCLWRMAMNMFGNIGVEQTPRGYPEGLGAGGFNSGLHQNFALNVDTSYILNFQGLPPTSAQLDGGYNILFDSGTHTTGAESDDLVDDAGPWTIDELIGGTVLNLTDGSSATITDNETDSVVGALSGGGKWTVGDTYNIYYRSETTGAAGENSYMDDPSHIYRTVSTQSYVNDAAGFEAVSRNIHDDGHIPAYTHLREGMPGFGWGTPITADNLTT